MGGEGGQESSTADRMSTCEKKGELDFWKKTSFTNIGSAVCFWSWRRGKSDTSVACWHCYSCCGSNITKDFAASSARPFSLAITVLRDAHDVLVWFPRLGEDSRATMLVSVMAVVNFRTAPWSLPAKRPTACDPQGAYFAESTDISLSVWFAHCRNKFAPTQTRPKTK